VIGISLGPNLGQEVLVAVLAEDDLAGGGRIDAGLLSGDGHRGVRSVANRDDVLCQIVDGIGSRIEARRSNLKREGDLRFGPRWVLSIHCGGEGGYGENCREETSAEIAR
jgi:hypothetical protein